MLGNSIIIAWDRELPLISCKEVGCTRLPFSSPQNFPDHIEPCYNGGMKLKIAGKFLEGTIVGVDKQKNVAYFRYGNETIEVKLDDVLNGNSLDDAWFETFSYDFPF